MKYLIGIVFATVSLVLFSLFITCAVLTFTTSALYAFVAIGIALPAVVAFAGTTAAFAGARDY